MNETDEANSSRGDMPEDRSPLTLEEILEVTAEIRF